MKRFMFPRLAALALMAALCCAAAGYASQGSAWAASGAALAGGRSSGTVTDRNGVVLWHDGAYPENELLRLSTAHAVGDGGCIGTGARTAERERLTGFHVLTGTRRGGGTVRLSIDSRLNMAAYEALAGRAGAICMADCATGELICLASSPAPDLKEGVVPDSSYIDRALSASYTPGSVYKLVTLAAALEEKPDAREMRYTCEGSDGGVTCPRAHGLLSPEDALTCSCNCFFASLARALGGETMAEYAEKFGFTAVLSASKTGIKKGTYDISDGLGLAWSGAGQYNNKITPAAMLRFLTAAASGGTARELSLAAGESGKKTRLMSESTAKALLDAMDACVVLNYGADRFPDVKVKAKSGTAETGTGSLPHALFAGVADIRGRTIAFTAVIEHGGGGLAQAGAAVNDVLQAANDIFKE